MKNVFSLLIIFLFEHFVCSSQEITKRTTQEILELKQQKGINFALSSVPGDMPIYMIDTILARDFVYNCDSIEDEIFRLKYLTNVGSFLHDHKLNTKLVERVAKYRSDYLKNPGLTPVIEDDLFYAVIFQHYASSIEPLKNEYTFWKETMDSFVIQSVANDSNVTKAEQTFKIIEYNAFMLAWTIYKLNDKTFTADFVNRVAPNNAKYRAEKIRPKKPKSRRTETLKFSKPYTSLTEIDFINEPAFKKILGTLPASLKYSITLIYNSNVGMVNFDSWFNRQDDQGKTFKRTYTGHTFKIELIGPTKAVVTWVYGYIS